MGIELAIGALVASAAAAAAGTGYAVYAGEQGRKAQKEAANRQEAAQREAATQARSQQRRSQQAMAMANRREPDVASILQSTMDAGGPTSTMLTGPMGVNPADLNLGRQSLLGG
jgi:uncharacterized protein HemX